MKSAHSSFVLTAIFKKRKMPIVKLQMKKQLNVFLEPPYSPEELKTIDQIVEWEKDKAKIIKSGKKFSAYIRKIFKKFFYVLF